MAFTPKVKVHLYETAHSGFYGDARSAELVNLLPKTWTKYTVTDGEWKEEKTIEPLVKRDIYLANMIDAVDYDKRHHYEASSHFIIDHENKVMSVNPFDTMYHFENGLIYNPDNYTIKTDTPPKLGGLDNKLVFDHDGLKYVHRNSADITEFNKNVIGKIEASGLLPPVTEFPNNANVVIVTSAIYEYNDDVYSGCSAEGWEYYNNYDPTRPPDVTYNDYEPVEPYTAHDTLSSIFDPTDDRGFYAFSSEQQIILEGGKNYIEKYGSKTMIPTGVLYIYD